MFGQSFWRVDHFWNMSLNKLKYIYNRFATKWAMICAKMIMLIFGFGGKSHQGVCCCQLLKWNQYTTIHKMMLLNSKLASQVFISSITFLSSSIYCLIFSNFIDTFLYSIFFNFCILMILQWNMVVHPSKVQNRA